LLLFEKLVLESIAWHRSTGGVDDNKRNLLVIDGHSNEKVWEKKYFSGDRSAWAATRNRYELWK